MEGTEIFAALAIANFPTKVFHRVEFALDIFYRGVLQRIT